MDAVSRWPAAYNGGRGEYEDPWPTAVDAVSMEDSTETLRRVLLTVAERVEPPDAETPVGPTDAGRDR